VVAERTTSYSNQLFVADSETIKRRDVHIPRSTETVADVEDYKPWLILTVLEAG
jgi:hypothetical protein